jgi:hypothetical protein
MLADGLIGWEFAEGISDSWDCSFLITAHLLKGGVSLGVEAKMPCGIFSPINPLRKTKQ